ncbi:MAG TPA: LytTR family transcriptional regulator DNA-binding domain-containing protein, partial [Flavobacteriales bacterium]|nr:LytTR family transcriptional regulator DNA-binding domain-containing protein [Flavobacteriales bacterium]
HAVFTNPREIAIHPKSGDVIHITTPNDPISIGKLGSNRFWVGFRYGGVGIFDLNGKRLSTFLNGKSVTRLFVDHEGGYWFSTLQNGIYHAKNTSVFCQLFDLAENNWIHSLGKDEKNNLWVGSYNGNVFVLDKKNMRQVFTSVKKRPAKVHYNRFSSEMQFCSDENLYTGQSGKNMLPVLGNPLGIYRLSRDSLLFCGYQGIMVHTLKKRYSLVFGSRVSDLYYYEGRFYLGTHKGVFVLKNIENIHSWKEIKGVSYSTFLANCTPEPVFQKAIPYGTIVSDIEMVNGSFLISTMGLGMVLLKNGSFNRITQQKGLSDNFVKKLYCENDSVIWACTNSGLNRILLRNGKLEAVDFISTKKGLISNEVTCLEIIGDTVWVGTRNGLCYFPKSIFHERVPERNYYLEISALRVNDKKRLFKKNFELGYKENRIEFNFKGKSFLEFAPLTYRYKLQGLETKWNYTKNLSTVYSSIPPGSYTFIVQVKGTNQFWESGEQTFSFTINPPFWKTWWFFIGVSVALLTLVYLFFKFRILTYNRDITRELLRQILKRLTKKTHYVVFREQGKDIRIPTTSICYVKSDGNYIDIHADTKKYTIRYKIGDFLGLVPDPLEYLRINRSYIVRLDKVQEKSKKEVTVKGERIAVGETYIEQLEKIMFRA